MSRRSLMLIMIVAMVSYACYRRADHNPYGRYFAEIMEKIDRNYVEPVDNQKLFEGALEGMVGKLDDYSSFISRRDADQFHQSLDQKFGGVGIEVSVDPKTQDLTVMSPLVGTPAYIAGVRAGDKIVSIDGNSTKGFSLKDAVALLRGKEGEPVTLSVVHDGETKPVDYTLVRKVIKVDSVLGDLRGPDDSWNYFLTGHPGIGYIRITTFGELTVKELQAALAWLQERHCRGAIIDLRNNPGGLLPAATETCDLFLDSSKLIVSTRGREGKVEEEIFSTGSGPYPKLPLVILVNHYSASASEIVAACLQDQHRAVIVGERSWGKGTVQKVLPVEGGRSRLKLTTASYWRPSGRNIHRLKSAAENDPWGVDPDEDCAAPMTDKELTAWLEYRRDRDIVRPADKAGTPPAPIDLNLDPALKRALEVLQKKETPAKASETAAG